MPTVVNSALLQGAMDLNKDIQTVNDIPNVFDVLDSVRNRLSLEIQGLNALHVPQIVNNAVSSEVAKLPATIASGLVNIVKTGFESGKSIAENGLTAASKE